MPFIFNLEIDCDDDCLLVYEDKAYCYYRDDLEISEIVSDVDKAFQILDRIYIAPDFKASNYLKDLFEEWKQEKTLAYEEHGNFSISFSIVEIESVVNYGSSITEEDIFNNFFLSFLKYKIRFGLKVSEKEVNKFINFIMVNRSEIKNYFDLEDGKFIILLPKIQKFLEEEKNEN